MKGKLATYEYGNLTTPRFIWGGSPISASGLLVVLSASAIVLYFYAASNVPFAYLIGLVALIVAAVALASKGPGLVISSKYLVFGNTTILYENITMISINEANHTCALRRQSGDTVQISASKFNSNANKEWKIKKNKQQKFYKVVTKVTDHALRENPHLALRVVNADRFKNYPRAVLS